MEMKQLESTKLNNSNYENWKIRTEALLIREGLWKYVKNDIPPAEGGAGDAAVAVPLEWAEFDERARATILLLLEENQYGIIKATRTAKGTWEALAKHHQKATLSTRVSLLEQLSETRYRAGDDIEEYIAKMENIYTRLCSAGKDLGEDTMVAFILRGLPRSFNALTTALEARSDDELTLGLVREKLLDEVSKQNRDDAGPAGDMAYGVAGRRVTQLICHFCKKPGHKQRDCRRYLDQQDQDNEDDNQQARYAFAVTSKEAKLKKEWIVDSGASAHMTSNRSFFEKLRPVSGDVVLADGRILPIEGVGSGNIVCNDGKGNSNRIRLYGVLFVPRLAGSMLSVMTMTSRKAKVEFEGIHCKISVDGQVVAVACKTAGQYKLEGLTATQRVRFEKEKLKQKQSRNRVQSIEEILQPLPPMWKPEVAGLRRAGDENDVRRSVRTTKGVPPSRYAASANVAVRRIENSQRAGRFGLIRTKSFGSKDRNCDRLLYVSKGIARETNLGDPSAGGRVYAVTGGATRARKRQMDQEANWYRNKRCSNFGYLEKEC